MVATPGTPANAPIVIAIHGIGDKAKRFKRMAKILKLKTRVIVPDGPVRHYNGRSWYDIRNANSNHDVERSTSMLLELIDRIHRRWPTAPRPYILGFSQGAVMGMSLAARAPHSVSGVVAIAGYLVPANLSPKRVRGAGPPILIIHGRSDSIVPYEEGREAAQRFRDKGYGVTLLPHSAGHFLPRRFRARIRQWLSENPAKF